MSVIRKISRVKHILFRDIDAVGDFYQPKNLRKIVIPDTVSFIGISAFTGLSDATIVFCHTEPSQVDVRDIFASLTNCKIIVKNQAMKEAIGSADDFYNSENTSVLLESELSAEERNAYLTPATDPTFADGSRTKEHHIRAGGKLYDRLSAFPGRHNGCCDMEKAPMIRWHM